MICDGCTHEENCPAKAEYGGAKRCSAFKPQEMTNEEWLRSATFEELAGAIYEWHTKGYARGKNGLPLNPITEVVEWLKEKHDGNMGTNP